MSAPSINGPGKGWKKIVGPPSASTTTPTGTNPSQQRRETLHGEPSSPDTLHRALTISDFGYNIYQVQSYARKPVALNPRPRVPARSTPAVTSAQQLPAVAPAVPLVNVTLEEVEELRDRLFKLTSDYQRLYGVFMPNGEDSPNAARWQSIDIDLPFLFTVRQRVVNLVTAIQRIVNGEEIENDRAFLASQRNFYNSLVAVVASAIERLTWLRRDLEGPNGYAYQYRSWYFQVIGNNRLSTDTSAAEGKEKKKSESGKLNKDAGKANDDEKLVSPSLGSEDGEERPEKRVRM
ncbi:hypothetical protein SBOR_9174 [Sclerotinia borealis F-4128]|uniref:Uncharacterized protein n=1 Tax=Sclerotinia borealis (strain F-4128) TaxID=1432307 RepID=W9C3I2_SCLBF|nr:hypothetical protein SBOR_9174 [Sclerotinia borealis F-4128]